MKTRADSETRKKSDVADDDLTSSLERSLPPPACVPSAFRIHPQGRVPSRRYIRRFNIAAPVLLLYGVAHTTLALAARLGIASTFLADALLGATRWIAAAAIVPATVYLSWSSLSEGLPTLRSLCGALLVSAAFVAAWLTILPAAGVRISEMPMTSAVSILLPLLLPLAGSVLAPWSFNRLRHL